MSGGRWICGVLVADSWSSEMSETVGEQKDLGRSDIYNVVFIRWAAFGF